MTAWYSTPFGSASSNRYFDTAHAIVQATISEDLPPLVAAVQRLLDDITGGPHEDAPKR
jgi:hypothetical protein